MYKLYQKDVCDLALSQVGKSCGKTNEYSKELDQVNFYNTKKNGAADSCSIFCDDMIFRSIEPRSADNARNALYEPNTGNAGAGCKQAAEYFKANNAFYTKPSEAHCGDKVFFKDGNGKLYHVGLVVEWNSEGIFTVEGNTNGGKVAKKFYKYSSSKIAGFGRPRYTGWQKQPEPDPIPEPTPKPDPDPVIYTYTQVHRALHRGMSGNDVGAVQAILRAAGYTYTGKDGQPHLIEVDEDFGAHTDEVVRKYQKANGLKVDGWVGEETGNKLFT